MPWVIPKRRLLSQYTGHLGSSKNNTNLGHEVSIENVKAFSVTPSIGPSEIINPRPCTPIFITQTCRGEGS